MLGGEADVYFSNSIQIFPRQDKPILFSPAGKVQGKIHTFHVIKNKDWSISCSQIN